jgi:riboflavin kinase/FMN adenylyltransferase
VRHEVAAGRVDEADVLLGRPWSLDGVVVHGDERGRTIGFPTANLQAPEQIQPAVGVYACRARLADGRVLGAVTNCGVRPTFGHDGWRIEAHLFDFAEDLYDQRLRLEFLQRLRGETRFASAAELIAQIRQDAQEAQAILARRAG